MIFRILLLIFMSMPLALMAQNDDLPDALDSLIVRMKKRLQNTEKEYISMSHSELEDFNNGPSFGAYNENYFVVGCPLNKMPTNSNSDIKFQISVRQILSQNRLPFNTALLLTYTQRSFWEIFRKSSPFVDNNYNPTLTLSTPIFKDNHFRGLLLLSGEHESNGRDAEASRSINFFSARFYYFLSTNLLIHINLWAGFPDEEGNPDLMSYRGYGSIKWVYYNKSGRLSANLELAPRNRFGSFNTIVGFNYKFNTKHNQYVFLQFYDGYAENLLDYDEYKCMVRMGICIKPSNFAWRK